MGASRVLFKWLNRKNRACRRRSLVATKFRRAHLLKVITDGSGDNVGFVILEVGYALRQDGYFTRRNSAAGIPAPGEFYVLLGPIGYEKEEIVLAHWNANTGQLTKATLLPKGFVAEGVAPIGGGKVLIVDDLKAMILIATGALMPGFPAWSTISKC